MLQVLLLAAGLLIFGPALWLTLNQTRKALPRASSKVGSRLNRILHTPAVQRWADRHPDMANFASSRFDTSRFTGLAATILASLFIYLMFAYLDSVFDFVGSAEVTLTDKRLAEFLYSIRDPGLVAVFGWITALGGWEPVLAMLVGTTGALIILRRGVYALGLWLTVIGNQVLVTLLKSFFDRSRSELGYFIETSGSFPSGHAASSIAIWGMFCYLAWRVRLVSAPVAGLVAIMLAGAIGLSRIYLIEHYLSDVLNGYLVGGLWLVFGIAFCEWRSENRPETGAIDQKTRRRLASVVALSGLTVALLLATFLTQPLNVLNT